MGSSTAQTWTGKTSDPIIFSASAQSRVSYIEITYETIGPKEPDNYKLPENEIDAAVGQNFTLELGEYHPEITWTSANPNIAYVDDNNVLHGICKGQTNITGTWKDSEDWNAGSATIKVTVYKFKKYTQVKSLDDIQPNKAYVLGSAEAGAIASTTDCTNYLDKIDNIVFEKEEGTNSYQFQTSNEKVLYISFFDKTIPASGGIQYKIHLLNYEGSNKYLKGNGDKKTDLLSTDESKAELVNVTFDTDGNISLSFISSATRNILYHTNNNNFKNYAPNEPTHQSKAVQLYEEVKEGEQNYYRPRWKEQTLQLGNQYNKYTINLGLENDHPEVTFKSSNENVALVEGNVVTAKGTGTAIITGSWNEDENWFSDSRAFRVTVIDPKKEPTLTFQHEIIHGKVGVGVAAQAVSYDGDGVVTYESSNTSAVTVNAETGMIRANDVKRVGKVFITATASGTTNYNPASASYILYIDPVPTPTDATTATFDFTRNTYNMYEFDSTNCTDANNIEYYEATVPDHNTVMIVNEQGIILNFLDREDDIDGYRLWKDLPNENYSEVINYLCLYDAHFSITAPEGCTLDKIEFTDYTDRLGELSSNIGTYHGSNDEDEAVWNAGESSISSVEFTATGKETHFGKIIVTLKKENTNGLTQPNLTFGERVYSVTAGDILDAQGATGPAGINIDYTIDNLSPEDYIIEPVDNTLQIYIEKPGVYTLRATSEATDKYVAGLAIARIDVFPQHDAVSETSVEVRPNDGVMVLPPEGGTVNFTEVSGPFSIYYTQQDGPAEYHDGSAFEIEKDGELHLTYQAQYARTFSHNEKELHVYTQPEATTHEVNGNIHIFKGANLYYRIDGLVDQDAYVQQPASTRALRAEAKDGGWVKAESGVASINVDPNTIGEGKMYHISTKTVKETALHGDVINVTNFAVLPDGGMSSITDVEKAEAGNVKYFNLNGTEVEGNLLPGLYIRLEGNKAQKVSVK